MKIKTTGNAFKSGIKNFVSTKLLSSTILDNIAIAVKNNWISIQNKTFNNIKPTVQKKKYWLSRQIDF